MSKYTKTFSTQAAYAAAQATLDLPNVSLIIENMTVDFNPYVPAPRLDIITYEANAKLKETTIIEDSGCLRTNAFNTTIKSHTFENGVGTIEFNDNVTSIGDAAFGECSGLTSVTIPSSVTSIGFAAFASCTGLTSVTIPSSVTEIGRRAFWGCTGLTSVTIPNGVTAIGDSAFYGCSGLTSVTIPNGVTSIGDAAFYKCGGLSSVTVNATTPPTLGNGVFSDNASGRKIYVPSESVDTYKAASNWSNYASDIYTYDIDS